MARAAEDDLPVLIPHVDDLGVSHGANVAFVELAGLGFVTCGSVMPPCAWFPEMALLAKARPALDVGVHLTLTSESRACRWRPISTASPASGLLDGDGYMWPDVPSLRHHADRGAVETELRAQIEAALAAGLDVTHLDTHMGAAAAPEFVAIYAALGREYRLPVLLARDSASYDSVLAIGPVDRAFYADLIAELDAERAPLIDRFAMGLAMTPSVLRRRLPRHGPACRARHHLRLAALQRARRHRGHAPERCDLADRRVQAVPAAGFSGLDRRPGRAPQRLSSDPRSLPGGPRESLTEDFRSTTAKLQGSHAHLFAMSATTARDRSTGFVGGGPSRSQGQCGRHSRAMVV